MFVSLLVISLAYAGSTGTSGEPLGPGITPTAAFPLAHPPERVTALDGLSTCVGDAPQVQVTHSPVIASPPYSARTSLTTISSPLCAGGATTHSVHNLFPPSASAIFVTAFTNYMMDVNSWITVPILSFTLYLFTCGFLALLGEANRIVMLLEAMLRQVRERLTLGPAIPGLTAQPAAPPMQPEMRPAAQRAALLVRSCEPPFIARPRPKPPFMTADTALTWRQPPEECNVTGSPTAAGPTRDPPTSFVARGFIASSWRRPHAFGSPMVKRLARDTVQPTPFSTRGPPMTDNSAEINSRATSSPSARAPTSLVNAAPAGLSCERAVPRGIAPAAPFSFRAFDLTSWSYQMKSDVVSQHAVGVYAMNRRYFWRSLPQGYLHRSAIAIDVATTLLSGPLTALFEHPRIARFTDATSLPCAGGDMGVNALLEMLAEQDLGTIGTLSSPTPVDPPVDEPAPPRMRWNLVVMDYALPSHAPVPLNIANAASAQATASYASTTACTPLVSAASAVLTGAPKKTTTSMRCANITNHSCTGLIDEQLSAMDDPGIAILGDENRYATHSANAFILGDEETAATPPTFTPSVSTTIAPTQSFGITGIIAPVVGETPAPTKHPASASTSTGTTTASALTSSTPAARAAMAWLWKRKRASLIAKIEINCTPESDSIVIATSDSIVSSAPVGDKIVINTPEIDSIVIATSDSIVSSMLVDDKIVINTPEIDSLVIATPTSNVIVIMPSGYSNVTDTLVGYTSSKIDYDAIMLHDWSWSTTSTIIELNAPATPIALDLRSLIVPVTTVDAPAFPTPSATAEPAQRLGLTSTIAPVVEETPAPTKHPGNIPLSVVSSTPEKATDWPVASAEAHALASAEAHALGRLIVATRADSSFSNYSPLNNTVPSTSFLFTAPLSTPTFITLDVDVPADSRPLAITSVALAQLQDLERAIAPTASKRPRADQAPVAVH